MTGRAVALTGMVAAGLGLLLGLRETGSLLNELAARVAAFGPGPIPHGIDWISQTEGARRLLARWDGTLALAAWLLGAVLAWRFLRLMNPGGTLLMPGARESDPGESAGPVPWGRRLAAWLLAPLHRPLVRRGFVAALATAYLYGGIRALIQGQSPNPPPLPVWGLSALVFLVPRQPLLGLAVAFLLGGALLWLLWGYWSAATPPDQRRGPREALVAGLIAGACAFPVLLPLTLWGRGVTRAVLDAVGLVDYRFWNGSMKTLAIGLPVAFFALGGIVHLLAGGRPRGLGRALGSAGLALLLLLGAGEILFYRGVARGRYDVGRDLSRIVGPPTTPAGPKSLLILTPGGRPVPGLLPARAVDRLDTSAEGRERLWEFLRRRRFQSAAAEEAFIRLHDAASLTWDCAAGLRVNLANLEHNPRPVFGRLLAEQLATCAPTPENRELLRQAADADRLHQSPYWMRMLGLLHHRFGDREKAVWCLGWAGLSEAEIVKAIGREAALTTGGLQGRVVLNGRPAAGLAVGIVSIDRWRALAGRTRPFELRWVAAGTVTDARGAFRLTSLGEGRYLLLLMDEASRLPILRTGARVEGSPGVILLDRARPRRDLGTIRVELGEPPDAPLPSPDAQSA